VEFWAVFVQFKISNIKLKSHLVILDIIAPLNLLSIVVNIASHIPNTKLTVL